MKDGIIADWHGALFFFGTLAKVGIQKQLYMLEE
jgi:hypothetical protein